MIFRRLPFSSVLTAAGGCSSCGVGGTPESQLMPNVNYYFKRITNVNVFILTHPSNKFHKRFIRTDTIRTADAASPPKEICGVRTPQPGAKEDLLASLDCVRKNADFSTLYLLESRLAKALPGHSDAAAKAEDISRLIKELEHLKLEKAALASFRHQTPKEIRSEYLQMMVTGLATGLAAAIHPIFFLGSIYGIIRIRRSRKAEKDRDEGTKRVEEINKEVKDKKARVNLLLDEITQMATKS